jgi:hypothetical protein
LVDFNELLIKEAKPKKARRSRRAGSGTKAAAPVAEAKAKAEEPKAEATTEEAPPKEEEGG